MRYTFLLYSNRADFADLPPEHWAKERELYKAYIGALQEAGYFSTPTGFSPSIRPRRSR